MTHEQCCCEDKTACGKDSCPHHRFVTVEFPDGSRFRKLETRSIKRGDELGENSALANSFEHHALAVYEGRKAKQGPGERSSRQARSPDDDLASENCPHGHRVELECPNDNKMLTIPQVYQANYCGPLDPRGRNFGEFLNPGKHLCFDKGGQCGEQERNKFQNQTGFAGKSECVECRTRKGKPVGNKIASGNKCAHRSGNPIGKDCAILNANEWCNCTFRKENFLRNECPHSYEYASIGKRQDECNAESVCIHDNGNMDENECGSSVCPNHHWGSNRNNIAVRSCSPVGNACPIRNDCPYENQHTRDGDSLGGRSIAEENCAMRNEKFVIDEVGEKHSIEGVKLRKRPDLGECRIVEEVGNQSSMSSLIKESMENEVERTKNILSRVRTPEEIEKISQVIYASPAWSGRKTQTYPAQNFCGKSEKRINLEMGNQICPSKHYLNNVVHVTVDSLEKVVKALQKSYRSNDEMNLPDDPELSNKILARKLIETQKGVDELKEEMQNLLHSLQDILLKLI